MHTFADVHDQQEGTRAALWYSLFGNTPLQDKEAQIVAIEQTFEDAQAVPKHPTKPGVTPVEVLPVLPDFKVGDVM